MMAQHIDCGSSILLDLTDDILTIIGNSLSPRDICNLTMCCKSLSVLSTFDKLWLTKCEELGVLSSTDLVEWRKVVSSYKALCRFLTTVKPLLGVWVHQNPELGNVVYVMPGFASVVGCRVIPQELWPSGIDGGPLLWAPVFEVISGENGAPAFILHGREKGNDYLYPGILKSFENTCDVLLLEVEPKEKNRDHLIYNESLYCHSDEKMEGKVSSSVRGPISDSSASVGHDTVSTRPFSGKLSRFWSKLYQSTGVSDTQTTFNKLSFDDRGKLLEIVTRCVRIQVPDMTCASLFPCLRGDEGRFREDVAHLSERRALLIKMQTLGWGYINWTASHEQPPSSGKNKEDQIHDFLSSGDMIGLTLKASTMELDFNKAWPCMYKCLLALYKYPIPIPTVCEEYAGLWGGTFGWPPSKKGDFKHGKVLFIVVLSYNEESSGERRLTATKILEGTRFARFPNGSTMFTANLDDPSNESFPWNASAESAFTGKGILIDYNFSRNPDSTPGSFFVLEDDVLAFVWKQPRSTVLTIQRLNMEELLKKGERVPTLPPVNNFSYLTTSESNVYTNIQT